MSSENSGVAQLISSLKLLVHYLMPQNKGYDLNKNDKNVSCFLRR